MTPETKIAIRRWTIRQLRFLLDFLDDRLHAAEVRLRDEIANTNPPAAFDAPRPERAKVARMKGATAAAGETFAEWELRRTGVRSLPRQSSRRRGLPARAFDLRFAR